MDIGRVLCAAAWVRTAVWGVLASLGLARPVPPLPGRGPLPSAAWLSSVAGEALDGVKAEPLGGNSGMVGELTAVTARRGPGGGTARFVLKRTRGDAASRARLHGSGGHRESRVLAWLAAGGAPAACGLPGVLYTHHSSALGESVILMEDLKARGMTFGRDAMKADAGATVAAAFRWAAGLHAAFWRDPRLTSGEMPWLKGAKWYAAAGAGDGAATGAAGRAAWERSLAAARAGWLKRAERGVRFDERLERVIGESLGRASWEALMARLRDAGSAPHTLCHGDFHAANAFFGASGAATFVDISEVGPWEPMTDLGQMVISDVPPAAFRGRTRGWVAAYWRHLEAAGGGTGYSEERAWADFCRAAPERWVWIVALMCGMPLPPQMLQYFHDQLLAFIDEHCPERAHFDIGTLVCF